MIPPAAGQGTSLEQRLAADVVLEKVRGTVNLYKVTKNRHPACGGTGPLRVGRIVDESTARDLVFKLGLAWTETDRGILGTPCTHDAAKTSALPTSTEAG